MGIDIFIPDCLLGLGNFYPKGRNMTKQDMINMAIEAGWDAHHAEFDTRIEAFAALVASAEREVCLQIAKKYSEHWTVDAIQARKQA
jgi:hypothetical protein